MKKTLITAIFLQCLNLYGMQPITVDTTHEPTGSRVTTLVAANYFDDEIRRFGQDITSEITKVKSGETTVGQAIVSVTGNCKSWFDLCKAQINERYMELATAQQRQKQLDIEALTAAKDQEIRTLQQRLDTLLSTHTEGLESLRAQLRVYDQQRIGTEQQVKTARERVDSVDTGELVTEAQLSRTMDRLTKDLGTIRTEIQDGKRTLENAFTRAEEKYSDGIETLIRSLEDRYADILSGVTKRSTEKIDHLTEAYERQIELIRHMLDEAIAATQAAEAKRELITKIGHICASNKLNPAQSIIALNASDIPSIEFFKREKDLLSLKDGQFRAFREFLIELDPTNAEHFSAFEGYMSAISTSQLTHPGSPFPGGCWVGWNDNHRSWVLPGYLEWLHKWGEGGSFWSEWWNNWHNDEGYHLVEAAIGRAAGKYNVALSVYNENVRLKGLVSFPSEAFSKLSLQVNKFLKMLIAGE